MKPTPDPSLRETSESAAQERAVVRKELDTRHLCDVNSGCDEPVTWKPAGRSAVETCLAWHLKLGVLRAARSVNPGAQPDIHFAPEPFTVVSSVIDSP
jgi:hypothetical protein